MMFSGFPFVEPMPFAHFATRDPFAPSMGCRSQSCVNPGYVTRHVRVAPPAVRRAVPKPQVLDSSNRIRVVRNQREVALLIELPGFSRDEISIQVKEQTLAVSASADPSFYYRFGATFEENFRLGENIDTDAITAAFQGGVLTLRLPYKAPKSKTPRRVIVEGPSFQPRQLTARRSAVSPTPSPAAAPAPTAAAAAPVHESPIAYKEPHQEEDEEWVEARENTEDHQEQKVKEEDAKRPALPAKERMAGNLPAFEPVLQFVGEPEKKDAENFETNTSPMTAEEKAAAWVSSLEVKEEEEVDADVEDGSIEDCEV